MQKDVIIRAMRFEDLDRVYEIEQTVFPNPWPRYFFEKDLESKNTVALIAELDSRVIGYSLGTCVDVECHITNIAVSSDYQKHGIGKILMKELERIARERGCAFAYLEVRTNNLPAVNFYKDIGYNILYVRKQYYIDGDDAYVMHKELK